MDTTETKKRSRHTCLAAMPGAAMAEADKPVEPAPADDAAEDLTEAELDAIIAADEKAADEAAAAARLQSAPLPTEWSAWDPRGLRQPLRVEYRGAGRVEVTIGLCKQGVKREDADRLVGQVRGRVAEAARQNDVVKKWYAAIAEKARHDRAARIARTVADSAAAQRAEMVARGDGDDLAAQLRTLDEKATAAHAAAVEAEELIRFANEAVAARRRDALAAIASVYTTVSAAAVARATREVDELVNNFVRDVADQFDVIVQAQHARESLGGAVGIDRTPLANQLLLRLEAEAAMAAARPAKTSA